MPSWSATLSTALRVSTTSRYPTPDELTPSTGRNPTKFAHPEGTIWRQFLSSCVYSDLGGYGVEYDISGRSRANAFRLGLGVRRFVRIESVGLSGVVLYEFPPTTHSFAGSGSGLAEDSISETHKRRETLTLERIFGDESDKSDLGMDVDELLDMIDAKVIYFPSYACTSFMIGHAMTASLLNRPAVRPRPAREGFFIYSGDESFLDFKEHMPSTPLNPPVASIQQLPPPNSELNLTLASPKSLSPGSGRDLLLHNGNFFCSPLSPPPSSLSEDYVPQQLQQLSTYSEIQLSETISQENVGLNLSCVPQKSKFLLHKNDPHAALCVRTSVLPLSAATIPKVINFEQTSRPLGGSIAAELVLKDVDQYEDDEYGNSSLESMGPCTPPIGCSQSCENKREFSWTGSFLEFCQAAEEELEGI